MKRPTWATVVGILGIIFGCLGILSAGPQMMMPQMAKFQQKMFSEIQKEIQADIERQREEQCEDGCEDEQAPSELPVVFFDFFTKMWNFPDWYGTWSIISGILILIVSAFYLFASIRLLQIKPSGIRMFYWAAGSKIALGVLMTAVAISAMTFMGFAMIFGGLFGIVIHIILIIVVASGNKAAFYNNVPPPLPGTL